MHFTSECYMALSNIFLLHLHRKESLPLPQLQPQIQFLKMPKESSCSSIATSSSRIEKKCTHSVCVKGLKGRGRSTLNKHEKDHLLRIHSMTSVRTTCPTTGAIAIFERDPTRGMKFQCICGLVFLSRDAVR